jgi:hypothetical protein
VSTSKAAKASADKKARRKKRLASRNERWLSPDAHAEVEGVAKIANVIIPRGWVFDAESSRGDVISWHYPPSEVDVDVDDDSVEAVTRIWLSDPAEPHVLLAGSTEGDGSSYSFGVDELFARLPAIEAYRAQPPADA